MSNKKEHITFDKFGKGMIILVIVLFSSLLLLNIGLGLYTYFSSRNSVAGKTYETIQSEASMSLHTAPITSISILGREIPNSSLSKNDTFHLYITEAEEFAVFISPNLDKETSISIEDSQLIMENITNQQIEGYILIMMPSHSDLELVTLGAIHLEMKDISIDNLSLSTQHFISFTIHNTIINNFNLNSVGNISIKEENSSVGQLDATVVGNANISLYLENQVHSIQNTGMGNYQLRGSGSLQVNSSGYIRVNHHWAVGTSQKEVVI